MLLQGGMILLLGWGIGQFQEEPVRFANGLPGLLGGLVIAILFGLGLAGFNVFVAMQTRNTETAFLVANFLTLPLLFTSSAMLPVEFLPDWLQVVARINPVTYTISSIRLLFNGPQAVPGWDPAQLLSTSVLVLGGIALVTLILAVRSFRRAVR
jgi:ABC-2 type transport system permease protein